MRDDQIVALILDRVARAKNETGVTAIDPSLVQDEPELQAWMSELQSEVDAVYMNQDPEACVQAQLSMDLRRCVVYYRGGFDRIAKETLREAIDAAQSVVMSDTGLAELASTFLARMEAGENLG